MTETLRYSIGRSPLGGLVLVAESPAGVCAILPGENPGEMIADMMDRFPGAHFTPGGVSRRHAVLRLLAQPTAPAPTLDPRGTAFQRRVWETLRRLIAPGETRSYAAVAEAMGLPGAARAIAAACAANPLAVAVPCHRVVPADGSLGGYRWGEARKRALLEREGAINPGLDLAA